MSEKEFQGVSGSTKYVNTFIQELFIMY